MGKFGWSYPPGAENDPFAPYNMDDDWGLECDEVRNALKAHDTGRWDWEKIDCCLTGKDADLEPWGDQGIEVISCDNEQVACVAHLYKSFVGTDVCLNLEHEIENGSDETLDAAIEAYLTEATLVVQGCAVGGEWDGDSWAMSEATPFNVDWVMDGDNIDYEKTAQAIVDAAEEVLRPFVDELCLADEVLNMLAGWTDGPDENGKPIKCEAGKPGQYSAWKQPSIEAQHDES